MKAPKKGALESFSIQLLLLIFALIYPFFQTLGAQENEPAKEHGTTVFDQAFPDGDPVRNIIEPIFVGKTTFAQRLQSLTTLKEAQSDSTNTQASAHPPLGLVLSGGSARAYAHIGVLKELEKAGIYPDFIVANSMGAIIGMLYAAGFSPDDIQLLIQAMPLESYFNIVLPTNGGFINSEGIAAAIHMLVGNLDISETTIPIIVTAEDLRTRQQIWFAQGPFERIMTAAFAMPVVFEPQHVDNFILIDGGIAAIIPIEPAQQFTNRIIVSTALYNRAMSFSNPLTVINRAIDIAKTRTSMSALEKINAFIIRNNVETLSYMQFSDPNRIIAKGEESAAIALAALNAQERALLKNPPSPSLAATRALMHQKLIKTIEALRAGCIPSSVPTVRIAPVLRLFPTTLGFAGETETIPRAGFSAVFSAWKMKSSLSYYAALAPETDMEWALDGSIDINPIGALMIKASARLWGDYSSTAILAHTPTMWEFAASLKSAKILGATKIAFTASADVMRKIGAGNSTWQSVARISASSISTGLELDVAHIKPWYSLEIGEFVEDTANAPFSTGLEGAVMLGLRTGIINPRARSFAKIALNGIPFSESKFDGFRSGAASVEANSIVITNTEIALTPGNLFFNIAETALVQKLELAPFFDTKWSAPAGTTGADGFGMKDWAAGLSFSFEVSAFGLSPAILTTYASYSASGVLTFQIRAGTLFP